MNDRQKSPHMGAQLLAKGPAKIRRPQVAHHEPRLEGTPEEALEAQRLIRAQQAKAVTR